MQTEQQIESEAIDADAVGSAPPNFTLGSDHEQMRDARLARERERDMELVRKTFEHCPMLMSCIQGTLRTKGPFVDGVKRNPMSFIESTAFMNATLATRFDDFVWFFTTFKDHLRSAECAVLFASYITEMNTKQCTEFYTFVNNFGPEAAL